MTKYANDTKWPTLIVTLKTITLIVLLTVVTAAAQRREARLAGLNSIFARQTKSSIKKMPTAM